MKRIKIILCSLLCISLVGCSKSTVPTLAIESLTLEYGENPFEEAKLEDLLENYDDIKEQYQFSLSLVSDDDEEITADSISGDEILAVGKYTLIIDYVDDEEPLKLPVEIKDTVAPEFKDFKDKVSIDYGYAKDLANLFSATDLADVKISVDGDVNTKKAGDYEVTIIAEDAHGNKTEKDCTITVKSKPKEESTTSSSSSSSGSTNSSSTSSGNVSSNTNQKPSSSTGGSSSSSGTNSTGSSSGNTSGKPACTVPSNQYGNSGMRFDTKEEAHAWATAYIENDDKNGAGNIVSYMVSPMFNTCDQVAGYTVGFTYEGEQILPDF